MRQTSRAVALLLAVESAQAAAATPTTNLPAIGTAAYYDTVWMPSVSAANGATASLALNSRQAGYTNTARVYDLTAPTAGAASWAALTYQKAVAEATLAESTGGAGSFCIPCIANKGVWCSRTYSYVEDANAKYQLEVETAKVGLFDQNVNVFASEAAMTKGASFDQGSCCNSETAFNAFVGTQSATRAVEDANAATGAGVLNVAAACVAFKSEMAGGEPTTNTSKAWGVMKIDNSTVKYTSWWCSNGLYKNVTASGTVVNNSQQVIAYGINKRMELAMVGCPQKGSWCGTQTTSTALTASTGADGVAINVVDTITLKDKCTYVATSVDVPPAFTMSEGTGAKGLTTSNWVIHAMEYTATANGAAWDAALGSLQSSGTATDGYVADKSALQSLNFIPRFNMPADQFATLRTWYGEATVEGAIDTDFSNLPSAWLTPGQAPVPNSKTVSANLAQVESQRFGNVANVPFSTIATVTGDTPVGNVNYGSANAVKFDLRVVRYFPAETALTVYNSGKAQQDKYTTALGAYNTAKTAWDNYVALLEKNNKTDAFAALFSPPKAPTVPPLPAQPWTPAKYAGYVRATPSEIAQYLGSSTQKLYATASNPTNQQFWATISSAQTVGGWGSFTAQILRYRNLWGKSFGTIGYSGDATNTKRAAVWNYKWTCAAAKTSKALTSEVTPCDATYASNGSDPTQDPTLTTTAANTTTMVSVVSLWSTSDYTTAPGANAAYAFTKSSLAITWKSGAWSGSLVGLRAMTDPVAATAAAGLSGVAGAQALAATSAAALAVAAALY